MRPHRYPGPALTGRVQASAKARLAHHKLCELRGSVIKKLINDPARVVAESVEGFGQAHAGHVRVHPDPLFITRRNAPRAGKVAVISGGGSGHEPLHGGYVGLGMLDAAVPGAVFSSPTPDAILAATIAANTGAGAVHIVKNYTGDVLNFETAAELAQAAGVEVRTVLVNDDVAVEDSLYTAGRRGVAGTVLVEKIAGAAAERGDRLDAVVSMAQRVNDHVRSMGMALRACTVPHAGVPSFELTEHEMELGIGIHGEPGRHKIPLEDADRIVERLLDAILADLAPDAGAKVLLLVNGMGGTPLSELYIVYRHAATVLEAAGLIVERSLVGNYATALDMQGCSLSVLLLDADMIALWDAPVNTPALRWGM